MERVFQLSTEDAVDIVDTKSQMGQFTQPAYWATGTTAEPPKPGAAWAHYFITQKSPKLTESCMMRQSWAVIPEAFLNVKPVFITIHQINDSLHGGQMDTPKGYGNNLPNLKEQLNLKI